MKLENQLKYFYKQTQMISLPIIFTIKLLTPTTITESIIIAINARSQKKLILVNVSFDINVYTIDVTSENIYLCILFTKIKKEQIPLHGIYRTSISSSQSHSPTWRRQLTIFVINAWLESIKRIGRFHALHGYSQTEKNERPKMYKKFRKFPQIFGNDCSISPRK